MEKIESKGEIALYRARNGKLNLDVRLENETVWLTQRQLADLYNKSKQNISLHINNIFEERELIESSVVKEYLTTAADGKIYATKYYNLRMVIAVGIRVKSKEGTNFRIWANDVINDHITKGFTVYEKRLKKIEDNNFNISDNFFHMTRNINHILLNMAHKSYLNGVVDETEKIRSEVAKLSESVLKLEKAIANKLPKHNNKTK